MQSNCKHRYIAIGQNTVSMGNGVIVITSVACSKCGENFVKATQIPFVMPKEENKSDLVVPKLSLRKK